MDNKGLTAQEKSQLLKMREQGEKLTYIAYKMHMSLSSVVSKLREIEASKDYKKWTTLEWIRAKELKKEGFSYREIAKILDREMEHVKQKFYYQRKLENNI